MPRLSHWIAQYLFAVASMFVLLLVVDLLRGESLQRAWPSRRETPQQPRAVTQGDFVHRGSRDRRDFVPLDRQRTGVVGLQLELAQAHVFDFPRQPVAVAEDDDVGSRGECGMRKGEDDQNGGNRLSGPHATLVMGDARRP